MTRGGGRGGCVVSSSSLVKFADRRTSRDGRRLFWDRVGVDDLPFRGHRPPLYRDDEWDERVVRVADARNAFFDVDDPESNRQYLDVLECCFNGWFRLVYLERFCRDASGRRTNRHYVEWVEYYLEDGSRTPYAPYGFGLEYGLGPSVVASGGPGG